MKSARVRVSFIVKVTYETDAGLKEALTSLKTEPGYLEVARQDVSSGETNWRRLRSTTAVELIRGGGA